MSFSGKDGVSMVVVAQTPFQLFSAIMVCRLSGVDADLWLIDPGLKGYLQPCIDAGLWRNVNYLEINNREVSNSRLRGRLKRVGRLFSICRGVVRYMRSVRPRVVVIFSDNHEVTAAFARIGKQVANARVVMVEEGSAVYFSYRRVRASFLKRLSRRIMGFDNPDGYSIGWSPYVDAVLVSDLKLAHPDYVKGRQVFQFPAGPYPRSAVDDFLGLVSLDFLTESIAGRDVFFLGQPWVEIGAMSSAEERENFSALDNSSFAERMVLKPHPFDRVGKYDYLKNIFLADDRLRRVPAEVVFEKVRPRVVVSVFSSAVLNYCLRSGGIGIFFSPKNFSLEVQSFLEEKFKSEEHANVRVVHSIHDLIKAIDAALLVDVRSSAVSDYSVAPWEDVMHCTLAM